MACVACALSMHHAGNFTVLSYFNSHNNNTQQHRLSITEAIVQVSKLKAVVLIYVHCLRHISH